MFARLRHAGVRALRQDDDDDDEDNDNDNNNDDDYDYDYDYDNDDFSKPGYCFLELSASSLLYFGLYKVYNGYETEQIKRA